MVVVDMSARLEVERPGDARGVFIVRPLTYREFMEFAASQEGADGGSASNIEGMMQVCKKGVVSYRIDGVEHTATPEMLEGAAIADIVACFKAIVGMSKVGAEDAGK